MAAVINPEKFGRPLLAAILYWRGFLSLLGYAFGSLPLLRRAPVWRVFLRQIYFTGVQALRAVGMIAAIAGIVITTQIASLLGGASPTIIERVLLWTLVRELGPVLSAIVVIARSSAAVASELANMQLRGELDSLRRVGINPLDYLVMPRIAGITVAMLAVTVYFQVIAVFSGLGFLALVRDFSFARGLENVAGLLTLSEVLVSLFKAFLFGLVISATSCLYGLRVGASVTDVPRVATRAVLRNVVSLFVLDAVATYIFFV